MTIQPTPIELEVLLDDDIAVELDVLGDEEVQLEVWSEVVREHADYPDYDGEYVITPSFDSQMLQTTGKIMRDDVTVAPITGAWVVQSDLTTVFSAGTNYVKG